MNLLKFLFLTVLVGYTPFGMSEDNTLPTTTDEFASKFYAECFVFYVTFSKCISNPLPEDLQSEMDDRINQSKALALLYSVNDVELEQYSIGVENEMIKQIEQKTCKTYFSSNQQETTDVICSSGLNDPAAVYQIIEEQIIK